jgi:hypothetical protein
MGSYPHGRCPPEAQLIAGKGTLAERQFGGFVGSDRIFGRGHAALKPVKGGSGLPRWPARGLWKRRGGGKFAFMTSGTLTPVGYSAAALVQFT